MRLASALLAALVLSPAREASVTGADDSPPRACAEGYYQRERIVLTCAGGRGRAALMLMPVDMPQRAFRWHAPRGTQGLRVEAVLQSMDGQAGGSALTAGCEGSRDEEPLVGHDRGVLSQYRREAQLGGARWSWSGDPDNFTSGPIRQWLHVDGALSCDVRIAVANQHASVLVGDLQISWSGISPCPEVPRGCAPCPEDVCNHAETAFCDGGRYWDCRPVHPAAAGPGHERCTDCASTTEPPVRERQAADPLLAEAEGESTSRPGSRASGAGQGGASPPRDGADGSTSSGGSREGPAEAAQAAAQGPGHAEAARAAAEGRGDNGEAAGRWPLRSRVFWVVAVCCLYPALMAAWIRHLVRKRCEHKEKEAAAPNEDSVPLVPPAWVQEQDAGGPADESRQSGGSHSRPSRQGYPPGYEPLQTA